MATFKYKQDGKDGSLAYPAGMYKVSNNDGSPFFIQILDDLSSKQMETYINNNYADFVEDFPNGDFVTDLYKYADIDDVTDKAFNQVIDAVATWWNPVLLERPLDVAEWQEWHKAGGPGNYVYSKQKMAQHFAPNSQERKTLLFDPA